MSLHLKLAEVFMQNYNGRSKHCCFNIITFLLLLLIAASAYGKDKEYVYEPYIIASYIINFTEFIMLHKRNNVPLTTICILGDTEVDKVLKTLIIKNNIHSHEIKKISITSNFSQCGYLYIGELEYYYLDRILLKAQHSAVLTIGIQKHDFIKRGGIIGFIHNNDKMRFVINATQAKKLDIYINSQLLQLADKVL